MKLLACGSNGNFQLGNNSADDFNQLVPCLFLVNTKVRDTFDTVPQIVCGGNHTFVLFNSGELFSCGDNSYGQCAHPVLELSPNIKVFTKIPGQWSYVCCGWEFSVLVNCRNDVFVCGLGLMGELGLGQQTTSTGLTWLMNVPVVNIKSSINFTILKDLKGQYYGWGNSRKGQLFTAKTLFWTPTPLELPLNDVLDFHVTKDSTILQTTTKLVGFGKMAVDVNVSPNTVVKTMWSSVHYRHNGTIKFIGNNSHGQHFPGDKPLGDSVFTVGSEHGLIQDSNQVYAWGWGEHGNCGSSLVPGHDQITFSSLNHIYTGEILLMAAGCATTFLVVS